MLSILRLFKHNKPYTQIHNITTSCRSKGRPGIVEKAEFNPIDIGEGLTILCIHWVTPKEWSYLRKTRRIKAHSAKSLNRLTPQSLHRMKTISSNHLRNLMLEHSAQSNICTLQKKTQFNKVPNTDMKTKQYIKLMKSSIWWVIEGTDLDSSQTV